MASCSVHGPMSTRAQRILDVGTGTGLLALMAKQRAPDAWVHGIDIEPDAYTQAQLNVATSLA